MFCKGSRFIRQFNIVDFSRDIAPATYINQSVPFLLPFRMIPVFSYAIVHMLWLDAEKLPTGNHVRPT